MNETLAIRLAAMIGLVLAAAVGVWWLGSTRLALDRGSDAGRSAADGLHALWLVRGMALATLGARVGALRGWWQGSTTALALLAPAWPVLVLAWSASATPLMHVALAELLLLVAAVTLPLIGLGLRRALRLSELADLVATGLGAVLAATLWHTLGLWVLPLA